MSNSKISFLSFAKEKINYIFNPTEKYHRWGCDNQEPFELLKLYESIPEHTSAIDFLVANIIGDGLSTETVNYWLTKKLIYDYTTFGGYAVLITPLRNGKQTVEYIDISKCRYNTDKTKIGYCDEFNKYKLEFKWYPISKGFGSAGIFIYKNNNSRELYPTPYYKSSVKSLKTMNSIIDYHNNNAENGFSPNVLINFNNGIPDLDTQDKIERGITEKFTGERGQKFILSFNESSETQTTIEKFEADNLDEKFETLQKFIQNQIIIAHKITSGQLIGVKAENQGFSKTEFDEALQVFQEIIVKGFRKELTYSFNILLNEDTKFIDEVLNQGGQQ